MPSRSFRFSVSLLVGLSLMGFGCKKVPEPIIVPDFNTIVAETPTPKTVAEPNTNDRLTTDAIRTIKNALTHLAETSSYRANMLIPTKDGIVTGNLEYVKTTGMHGQLEIPGAKRVELYLIGESIYFRANTTTWTNLSNTLDGAQTIAMLKSAFTVNDETLASLSSRNIRVTEISKDPSGCDRYVFSRKIDTGEEQTTNICIKDNLPTYLSATTGENVLEIRYRDFNKPIALYAPIK